MTWFRRFHPLCLPLVALTMWTPVRVPAMDVPYVGYADQTTSTGEELYMMLSSYKLEPYRQSYLDNTLPTLGRTGVHGILYSAVGGVTRHLAANWPAGSTPPDEVSYNQSIYEQAKVSGARLWLQFPEYYNHVVVHEATRTLTAQEIISEQTPELRQAFKEQFLKEFQAYSASAPADDCRVVLFEEAGIYHSAEGGGRFWASPEPIPATTVPPTAPNATYDRLFADHFKSVFSLLCGWIKSANPKCKVGVHLGHQALEDRDHLPTAFEWLARQGRAPEFIFYDLYLGPSSPQPDRWQNYASKLKKRRANIAALGRTFPLPAYHLAQLHTSNSFGHGLGFTPSRKELDDIIALDGRTSLGFDGVGYYTKNAARTDAAVSPDAFDPNPRGGSPAEESSTDRWDYGLAQLFEKRTVDYRNWFDLVLYGRFTRDGYRVYAQRADAERWDLIGYADRTIRKNYRDPEAVVFRFIDADAYLGNGRRTLNLKLVAAPGCANGTIAKAYIIPSQTSAKFMSSAKIKLDILSGEIAQYARMTHDGHAPLGTGGSEFKFSIRSVEASPTDAPEGGNLPKRTGSAAAGN